MLIYIVYVRTYEQTYVNKNIGNDPSINEKIKYFDSQ